MQFWEALRILRGVTALIGGGGKTSLLLRLARELSACGTVIVCTTTHIYPPDGIPLFQQPDAHGIAAALQTGNCICTGVLGRDGKLTASPVSIAELAQLADYVLVEADGAKHLPLKAHAAHEPVIPPEASAVIAVAGLSCIGKTVAESVHRAEIFCRNTDTLPKTRITPALVARHLQQESLHTSVYLNQADTEQQLLWAKEIAAGLACPVCAGALQKGSVVCLH